MKQLKFKFDLSSRVALYVPGTINVNETTNNEAQVKKVLTAFCGWFGGATASDARGGWLSQTAGLVIENVTIIGGGDVGFMLAQKLARWNVELGTN